MTFKEMGLIPEILKAIDLAAYEKPSPIQEKAIPAFIEGQDILASAQTGTGKTAAFAIPIIQKITESSRNGVRLPIRALVLAPTRELTEQIKDNFVAYSKFLPFKTGAIYGGVPQKRQEIMIDKGIDVLVATPGRLIDLIKQKIVNLQHVETFVLDEADTMLDMGFIKDVKHIYSLLPKRNIQTLMFSATISLEIRNLSSELLSAPTYIEMAPPTFMLDTITHTLISAEKEQKKEVLLDLLTDKSLSSVLVFTKTKHVANKLSEFLKSYGLNADAIHGNKTQNKRQQALNDFKSKKNRLLIATDIAARGIDISELTHVINFDVPLTPETYIHRIGRTGRAGLTGSAITLMSGSEKGLVKAIIKHTGLDLKEMVLKPVSEDSKFKRLENYTKPQVIDYQEQKRIRLEKEAKSLAVKQKNQAYKANKPATTKYPNTKPVSNNDDQIKDNGNQTKTKARKANNPQLNEAIKEDKLDYRKQRFNKSSSDRQRSSYPKKTTTGSKNYNNAGTTPDEETKKSTKAYNSNKTRSNSGYKNSSSVGGKGETRRPNRPYNSSKPRSNSEYKNDSTVGGEGETRRPSRSYNSSKPQSKSSNAQKSKRVGSNTSKPSSYKKSNYKSTNSSTSRFKKPRKQQ